MRGMRKMGLLAVAVMAVTAFVGTTAASAEVPGAFTTNKAGNPLETSKVTEHTWTLTGSNMNCNKISFSGTAAAATSREQTVSPKWEECTLFGFANGVMNSEGCVLKFTATTTGDPSSTEKTHASIHLEKCTNGGIIDTINVPFIAKCKVLFPNQEIKDAVHYSAGANNDLVIKTTAKSIKAEVQESTGSCPLTVGTHFNAEYTGTQTVKVNDGTLSYDKDHTP